jgi:hypothetical protein
MTKTVRTETIRYRNEAFTPAPTGAVGCELNEAFARFGERRVLGAAGDGKYAG